MGERLETRPWSSTRPYRAVGRQCQGQLGFCLSPGRGIRDMVVGQWSGSGHWEHFLGVSGGVKETRCALSLSCHCTGGHQIR